MSQTPVALFSAIAPEPPPRDWRVARTVINVAAGAVLGFILGRFADPVPPSAETRVVMAPLVIVVPR
jgi:hypothetical protein